MCVCVCAYMHTYTCLCVRACTRTYTRACVCVHMGKDLNVVCILSVDLPLSPAGISKICTVATVVDHIDQQSEESDPF